MSPRGGEFPEYGGTGDTVGARRVRHAFRYSVLACVFFAFALWFAEGYLRYSKPERLYRMALLHEDDSARAILRNLVPKGDVPPDPRRAKYLAALALIEDGTWDRARQGVYEEYAVDPFVLERYEQAFTADKEDPYILTMYGCALFQDGQYTRARDLFRDARRFSSVDDALPAYLEAAARAQMGELNEALNLLRQTNGNPAMNPAIPEPLWHASYPRGGMWYVKARQRVAARVLGPLGALKTLVCSGATKSGAGADETPPVDWDAWLRELVVIGERLVGAAETPDARLGILRAKDGLRFQRDALELLSRRAGADEAMRGRLRIIEKADAEIRAFVDKRQDAILAHERVVRRPTQLCIRTFLAVIGAYFLAYLLAKVLRAGRVSWSLPHPRWCYATLAAGAAAQFLALMGFTLLIRITAAPGVPLEALTWCWHCITAFLVLFGVVYPAIALPSAKTVVAAKKLGVEEEAILDDAKPARRTAYASLLRRYFGMLAGAFLFVFCAWTLVFRIGVGLYPFLQAKLLTTGLESAELAIIRQVQTLLLQAAGT